MKLAQAEIFPIHVPYRRTVKWHSDLESGGDYVVLKLTDSNGHVGAAEATTKAYWSGSSLRTLVAALEELFLPRFMDVDVGDIDAVVARLARVPDNTIAKALIASACLDLQADAAGVPLWKQWGGAPDVSLSWTVSRQAPDLMAAEAAEMVGAHGFKALKIKGGQGPLTDYQVIRDIRRAAGEGLDLYVDTNQAYDLATSRDYVKGLADLGVVMAEDPYPVKADENFRAFAASSPIPILVDTPVISARDAEMFFEVGAVAVSVKPGRIGLAEARRCAAVAQRYGRSIVAGFFGESDLGSAVNAQLAASSIDRGRGRIGALPAELSFFLMMREPLLQPSLAVVDGVLRLPDAPSIASLVDWAHIAKLHREP
jgi:L-alanine-DL-glutamate epimerase-like enolase superfamily enzyme